MGICSPDLLLCHVLTAWLVCCGSPQVYSFGVTLWEIMERKRPFGGMDGFQIQTQVCSLLPFSSCVVGCCEGDSPQLPLAFV